MIAVTGATGLLGSQIVRQLIAAGHEVVAFKRPSSDTTVLSDLRDRIRWREADLLDSLSIEEALANVTSVIHAAAIVSFLPRDKKPMFRTNVEGTRHLVDACLSANIKKLVHISSVAALGRPRNATVVDEDQKWVDSPHNSAYAESKYQAELEVMRGQHEGLNTIILNPSVILAPSDPARSSGKVFGYVLKGGRFYTDGCINYVSVRDVAVLAEKSLAVEAPGERFILSAGSLSYHSFFSQVAKHLNRRPPHINTPMVVLRLLSKISTIISSLTGTHPLITTEVARAASQSIAFSNAKARAFFEFEFEPLDKTLEWCSKYYLGQSKM